MGSDPRVFAVVPAAGHSRRMGRPKLTLPFAGTTVVETVLRSLDVTEITVRVVTVRRADKQLIDCLRSTRVETVCPNQDPRDMRESVQMALDYLEATYRPTAQDAWLLVPADGIGVSQTVVRDLVRAWSTCDADAIVPRYDNRRGHPALFRWSLLDRLRKLDTSLGLNSLLRDPTVRVAEHIVGDDGVLKDIDTPRDYAAEQQEWTSRQE